ncbi:MAG: HigA family addiction module antidote protein [Gammaproteobacteria bacterium]|nr:HigA family addiction module antidote protein [Gammaproteobacteria bacterium]
MNTMLNPPHPGEELREDVLSTRDLTVSEVARQIGVSKAELSQVLNGQSAISVKIAMRLEKWLGRAYVGRAKKWLVQQMRHDLWKAQKHIKAEPVQSETLQ